MKKRKFVGFMTILWGVPGLAGMLLFMNGFDELSFLVFLALLAVIFRGLCGVVGGVLLWRGSKLGYQLSLVMWMYMLVVGLIAFYQLFTGPYFTSFEFTPDNQLFWSAFGKNGGKLIWGVPFIYILIKSLFESRKAESENALSQKI